MPTVRNYNAGSIVYFQEDRGEDIFVLQKGKIILISSLMGSNEERREDVKLGEFFGVKSAMGHYPREETAQAIEKTSVVVFGQEEFEKYIVHNTRLIVKMLQVFSHELRDIHLRLRSILKVGKQENVAFELLNIAEAFHKAHNINHAVYAFQCYLKHYPNAKNTARAKELLEMCQQDKTYPSSYGPPEPESEEFIQAEKSEQGDNGALQEGGASSHSPLVSFHSKAQKALGAGKWEEAITNLQKCINEKIPKSDQEKTIHEKSHFELGLTLLKSKKYNEAGGSFSKYIKLYPTGEYIRHCIYQLALIQETQGNPKQARILYYKIATMQPHDDVTAKARKRLQQIGQN